MRKMKKVLCAVLTSAMVLAMAAPSFAAPGDLTHTPDTTITVDDGEGGSNEFAAYKLLNASNGVAADGETELYAYTVNPTYETILNAQLPNGQTDVIAYLASLDSEALKSFADNVYRAIKGAGLAPDATSTNNSFDVAQGYYLIADVTEFDDEDDNAVHSAVLLDTAGRATITIKTKKSVPEVDKKIVEGTASLDSADAAVGDDITYELIGTLPTDYARYTAYQYIFTDTLTDGLDFKANSNVDVIIRDEDGKERNFVDVTPSTTKNGRVLTVKITNLKAETSITSADKIIVRYKAQLNASAVVGGNGNTNTVKIEYSNNPYGSGTGTSTSTTVDVFTYGVTVNKTDAAGNALRGAGFTLYKQNDTGWVTVKEISSVDNNNVVSDVTNFAFSGLDEGTYKIEETTVPDGYNKAGDIIFTLDADTSQNAEGISEITRFDVLNVTVDGKEPTDNIFVMTNALTDGVVSTTVQNVPGTQLPSTGGIGTTIFYAAGIVLMAGAVFFVVRRKRA